MAKTLSITTLAKDFSNIAELQQYCNSQYNTIQNLQIQIKDLQEQIEQYKTLTNLEPVKIIVSKEQALLEAQIDILQQRGLQKELTLEDTKKLDLLVKNLKIVKDSEPKTLEGKSTKIKVSSERLLDVASQKIPETNEQ